MKAILLSLFLFCALIIPAQLVGQIIQPNEIITSSGLKIAFINQGKGALIEKGDKVSLHYTGALEDKKKFDSSRENNQPFEFILGVGQVIPGWEEGITYLRKGSAATLFVPSDLGYGDIAMPGIPANSDLYFDIEILDVQKGFLPKLIPFEKKKTNLLSSGIELMMLKKGKGPKVKKGKIVEVHYTGYLQNGNIFESSLLRNKSVSFISGAGLVLKGWEDAISGLRAGDVVQISIPSELGYGENGRPPLIPPNAKLFFNIRVISVK